MTLLLFLLLLPLFAVTSAALFVLFVLFVSTACSLNRYNVSAANMSPVPGKKSGKAGTSMQKARGDMSEVAVDPMTVSVFFSWLADFVSSALVSNVSEPELLWF